MKALRIILGACLLWFAFLPCLWGQEIIVVTEEFPPYNYTDPKTGEKTGLGTDVVKALLKEVGVKATINEYPWARAYLMAQVQKNVLIYSMKKKSDREKKFKWVGELVKSKVHLIALKKSPIRPSKNLNDFKPYIVGTVREGANAKQMAADGFPKICLTADRETNCKMLKKGMIDLWCTDMISARYVAKTLGDNPRLMKSVHLYEALSQEGLYLAFSLSTDDVIVEKFRKGFNRLKEKGVYDKIYKRYADE